MRFSRTQRPWGDEQGMLMVALLVALNVMAVMMAVALPAWQTLARREKEAELVFRGEQYARAIGLFQRKYGGAFPPSVDVLIDERLLRKKYVDPITGGEFELLTPGSAIAGASTSPILPGRGGAAGAPSRGGFTLLQPPSTTTGGRQAAGGRGATATQTPGRQTGARGSGTSFTSSFSLSSGASGGATGGIIGVRSKSTERSLRLYNGAETYDTWIFMATQATNVVNAPSGGQTPGGGRGRGDAPGGGRGRGDAPGAGRGRGQQDGARGGRGRGGFSLPQFGNPQAPGRGR